MSASTDTAPYYDPYDFEIDADPYPVWKRLRDEYPLYYNDKARLLRHHPVGRRGVGPEGPPSVHLQPRLCPGDHQIRAQMPPGLLIFDDPPSHTVYRGLLSRVFTPLRMNSIEPQVRSYCADALDGLRGTERFDVIAELGAKMPMRVIGMLLGIPEDDQVVLREQIDDGLRMESGEMPVAMQEFNQDAAEGNFGAYLDWRADNPSDDVMTQLVHTEFEDHNGVTRRLTREEILGYVSLLAGAGNETTTKLIGWMAKTLAEYPDQRRELVENPALIPNAVEETLRFEAPSPVQARYVPEDVEIHGQTVPEGSAIAFVNASANRDERKWGDTADRFDIHRQIDQHLSFGFGLHFCLGAALARLEGRVALEEFLKRFPEWSVDLENSGRSHTSTVRGWDRLELVIG